MTDGSLDRLVAILESARSRPRMYFHPMTPDTVLSWLHGLRLGASLAGLEWSVDHLCRALDRRGLGVAAANERSMVDQLLCRGFSAEAIVDELLSLELETWRGPAPEETDGA